MDTIAENNAKIKLSKATEIIEAMNKENKYQELCLCEIYLYIVLKELSSYCSKKPKFLELKTILEKPKETSIKH